MKQRHSELAIDLYRGIAALMVVLAHAITMALHATRGPDSESYPFLERLTAATVGSGVFWVWGFFVISGFCIHQSIERDRVRGAFDSRRYAIARLTRIYPLFLIGLLLAVAGWWITGGDDQPGSAFPLKSLLGTLMLAQQFTGDFPGFDPAWSLGNEVAYYALWPLALMLFRWQSQRAMVGAMVLAIAFTAVVVIVWKLGLNGDSKHWLIPVWCISALFVPWLIGAALAVFWDSVKTRVSPQLALGCLAWMLVIYAAQATIHYTHGRAFAYLLAAYAAAPGFALLMAGGHWLRLGDSPVWTARAAWLGTLSYPCYILHKPMMHVIEYAVMPHLPEPIRTQPVLHTLVLLLPALLFVSTVGIALENVLMAWRGRIMKCLRSPAASSLPKLSPVPSSGTAK